MQKFIARKGYVLIVVLLVIGLVLFNINETYSDKGTELKYELYSEILKNNTILLENDSDGLIYDSNDNYYYFNGNVENNYIVVNNELWRIVAINNDRSIKIIKNYGISNNKLYTFNNDYTNFKYQGSNVMNELLLWYDNNFINSDKYVVESEYCVLYQSNICLEKKYYKVGLLNIDEVMRAGGSITNNESYYLYNYYDWWIINNDYDEFIDSAYSGFVNSLGSIDKGFVDEAKTIRPVINLKKDTYINGNGTIDNPYYIVD